MENNFTSLTHWIVERKSSNSDGMYISALKTGPVHFVAHQNGNIESWLSPRRRIGLWNFDTQHVSAMNTYFNGKGDTETFKKYVRGLGYIYREYEEWERVDFIPEKKAILEMEMRSSKKGNFVTNLTILHEKAWPQIRNGTHYDARIDSGYVEIRSDVATTKIFHKTDGNLKIEINNNLITLRSNQSTSLFVYISCDGSEPGKDDFERTIEFHERPMKTAILETPSFQFNKFFLWAKHDLLELFTPTPIGNGFYAGIPQFSWFFGRDGEWISMAAMECGMIDFAKEHLDMLYSFSSNGRIPHEIPLSNEGRIDSPNYTIGDSEVSTQYMSIDSSPLWVISQYMLSAWSGKEPQREKISKVMDFCRSCDRDSDGLLENRFSEGLIGWPESWSRERDGICIDVNAWWFEAQRIHNSVEGLENNSLESDLQKFKDLFYWNDGTGSRAYDSMDGKRGRNIKGAMQIVPSIYFNGGAFQDILEWLYQPDLVTEWGVRSVSSRDPFYDGGYHTGTVWPLMTGWMALALYNNTEYEKGFEMINSFVRLAFSSMDPGRINETYNPEYLYGEGQFFQGWSSSLFIQSFIEGLLGITRVPENKSLKANLHSHLPKEWDELFMKNFPFKGKFYDIEIRKGDVINVTESHRDNMNKGKNQKFSKIGVN